MDRSYRRFQAWQACHALTLSLYRLTANWPRDELYGLVAQVRKAAVSTEANIAEGAAKRGPVEFSRFLDMSQGSLAELECHLELARDLGYLTDDGWRQIEGQRQVAARAATLLYRAMRSHVPRRT